MCEVNELFSCCRPSSSFEGTGPGSIGFPNGPKCVSDPGHPTVTTNSLESSCEDGCSGASTKPLNQLEPFDSNKPVDKLECASVGATVKSNIPQGPVLSEPVINKSVRREKEKGKTLLQNVDSAKKSKVRPESCGNNLVLAYRKDVDEVEIREIPSEDSRSSSDVEVDVPERSVNVLLD